MYKHPFKQKKLALSISMLVASSIGMAVVPKASAQDEEIQEVVVTGIRGSLQRAQAVKMDSSSVVEAISAEDIGKLPDSSIAESLARLPGLAGERRNGRTSGLSVRGFREDFVGTTMNGRELIGIGDNRGVEYDLYPSEIMSGAVVYKSPDASLAMIGIGGTVDLKTARPLDAPPSLTFNGTYEQNDLESPNPDFDDTGTRYALSYVDQFAEGKVGVALAYATTESPNQEQQFGAWGYSTNAITSGPYAGFYTPDGLSTFAISHVLERDTYSAVLQFAPTEKLTATLDYLYIDFSDTGVIRGFIEQMPHAADGSGVISAADGIVTSATTSGFHSVIRTDPSEKTGELTSYGLNLDYALTDDWQVKFDAAHSESSKNDLRAESYSGVGRAGSANIGAQTLRTWEATGNGFVVTNSTTDFSDYDLIRLSGPQSWGGSLAPFGLPGGPLEEQAGAPGVGFAQAQDGFSNEAIFDEDLDTFRLDATKQIEDSFFKSIQFGVAYSDHSKSKVNFGAFLTSPLWPLDEPIPADVRKGVADLSFAGLGNVVAYDGLSLINSGYYTAWSAAELEPDRLGDTYTVNETVYSEFVKVDFDMTVGSVNIFGNIGLRAIHTEQEASGFASLVTDTLFVEATPVSDGIRYSNSLPSLNLNFDFGEGHMVRFAAAKVISRPRIDALGPGSSIKFRNNIAEVLNTDPAKGPWLSTSGNAKLLPYEANQADLSYEWYFSDLGYVSATYFYKDLLNWHKKSTEVIDYSPYYIPGYHVGVDSDGTIYDPVIFTGVNTFQEDGLTGEVDGFEVQTSLPFGDFVEALEGLGLVFSASFTDGELDDGSRVPGLSEEVYSATVFYERAGFEIRVSSTKRSDFLSEERGGSNTIAEVTRNGTELVDAQISYDFADSGIRYLEGLRISLQGQNLTDEDDVNQLSGTGFVTKSQHYGTNYLLTANYSFW